MEEHNGSAESPQLSQGRHVAIKCGWLRKQGGFVKTWHTRWFVLKGEQLYYFKDEDETKPLVSTKGRRCKVRLEWRQIEECWRKRGGQTSSSSTTHSE